MLDSDTLQDDIIRTQDGYFLLVNMLSAQLPQPPKETPETWYKRLRAAIATVAGLCPVTLAEARLAARYVAAEEHAGECLRQVSQLRHNPDQQNKCRAQSNSMARQSESALRTLQRLQAARIKRDADPKSAEAAVWAEHIAAKGMMAALEQAVVPAVQEAAAPEEAPAPVVAAAAPERTGVKRSWEPQTAAEMVAGMLAVLEERDGPARETASRKTSD